MKVLNIGSLNIDKTYIVEKFVRPKETIRAIKYEEFCGGKGLNQSVALARAGAEVYHAGAVGKDGDLLLEMLQKSNVHTEYVKKVKNASGHAIIQIDANGQNSIIVTGGANDDVDLKYIIDVLDDFGTNDILLLQNEIPNICFAIKEAKARGMQVAFNPSPINESVWKCDLEKVDYFLLNEIEGKAIAGIESEEPKDILEELKKKYPSASIVLTVGEKGAYFSGKGELIYQKAFPVKAIDTTGAGDTFCGYFLAGITKGLSNAEILREASAASAMVVQCKGATTGIPTESEVKKFMAEY